MSQEPEKTGTNNEKQFSTFYVDGQLYGIDVGIVQEITRSMAVTRVPLAPPYIRGLINLRGQIATAISLKELFGLPVQAEKEQENLNVVCRLGGSLASLLVDQISDVVTVQGQDFEAVPDTVEKNVAQFLSGVYKMPQELLSIIETSHIMDVLNEQKN